MPVSGDTLLRLIRSGEAPRHPSPRVVGIDDWSFRRGQSYGTIVCDLERRRVIDLAETIDVHGIFHVCRARSVTPSSSINNCGERSRSLP